MTPKIRGMVEWVKKAGVSPSFAFGPYTLHGHSFAGGGFCSPSERLQIIAACTPANDSDSEANRAKARARAAASRAM